MLTHMDDEEQPDYGIAAYESIRDSIKLTAQK